MQVDDDACGGNRASSKTHYAIANATNFTCSIWIQKAKNSEASTLISSHAIYFPEWMRRTPSYGFSAVATDVCVLLVRCVRVLHFNDTDILRHIISEMNFFLNCRIHQYQIKNCVRSSRDACFSFGHQELCRTVLCHALRCVFLRRQKHNNNNNNKNR